MRNLRHGLASVGIEVGATYPVARSWQNNSRFRRRLGEADLVVINGEGTLHHGRRRGAELLSVVDAPEARDKPIVLVNALFQDNPESWGTLLRRLSAIYVRDPQSARVLEATFGLAVPVVPDLSFYSANRSRPQSQPTRSTVGFGDSVDKALSQWLWKACQDHPSGRYLPIRSTRKYRRFALNGPLNWLYNAPSVVGAAATCSFRRKIRLVADVEAFQHELHGLRLFVTGRFHGLCLALARQVPVVALRSNSFKNEALLEQVGLSPRRLIDADACVRIDPGAWAFDAREHQNLSRFLDLAPTGFARMFAHLRALADARG